MPELARRLARVVYRPAACEHEAKGAGLMPSGNAGEPNAFGPVALGVRHDGLVESPQGVVSGVFAASLPVYGFSYIDSNTNLLDLV